MKSITLHISNSIFGKIKNDLSSVFTMLTAPDIEEEENSFDNNVAISEEDSKILSELNKSTERLDKYAQEYVNSIGVPSKIKKQNKAKENTVTLSNHIEEKQIQEKAKRKFRTNKEIER